MKKLLKKLFPSISYCIENISINRLTAKKLYKYNKSLIDSFQVGDDISELEFKLKENYDTIDKLQLETFILYDALAFKIILIFTFTTFIIKLF